LIRNRLKTTPTVALSWAFDVQKPWKKRHFRTLGPKRRKIGQFEHIRKTQIPFVIFAPLW